MGNDPQTALFRTCMICRTWCVLGKVEGPPSTFFPIRLSISFRMPPVGSKKVAWCMKHGIITLLRPHNFYCGFRGVLEPVEGVLDSAGEAPTNDPHTAAHPHSKVLVKCIWLHHQKGGSCIPKEALYRHTMFLW